MNTHDFKLSAVSLSAVLSPPEAVVQDYLDFMLRAVTETVSETVVARPEISVPVREPVVETRRPVLETIVVSTTPSSSGSASSVSAAPEPSASAVTASPRGANGRPLWAQAPFECLLFEVVGLKLAAPLVELGGIARIGDGLTPIFGQSEWFMGLLRWNDRNIRVVDTARLIMPERLPALVDGQRPPYEFVLLIEGTDWGLAIDSATEALHLQPDEVRWRASLQNRQWLAGTVLEKMCALLDMGSVARLLQTGTTTE